MAKLKLSHKALILVAVPLVFELGFVATLNELLNEAEREAQREAEARAIVSHINKLLRILMESAGSVSAFGITGGSEEYGLRADNLRNLLPQEIVILDDLLKNKPEERMALDRIKVTCDQGSDLLKQVKSLYRQGAFQDANARIQKVRPLIKRVGEEVDKIRVEEEKIEFSSPKIQEEQRRGVRQLLLGGVIFNILLAVSLAVYFNRGTTRRLAILVDNSRRLAEGKQLNPPLEGNDEIAQLDRVFNEMAQKMVSAAIKERAIVEHAADVICSIDTNYCFTKVSPAASRVWGFEPEELIGKPFLELIHPSTIEASKAFIDNAKSADSSKQVEPTFETTMVRKDGTIVNILWSVYWSAGDKLLFCVAHDITERKHAENLLKETEARLRLIVESLPIGLLMVSDYGIVQLTNPTIEKMFGLPATDLIGEEFVTLLANEHSKTTFFNILAEASKNSHEIVAIRNDRTTFPAELSLTPVETLEGKRFLALIIDVTQRHEVERLKQEFIAMVSHELKTPLSSVQNYLELLAKGVYGTLTEKGSQKLPTIESNIQRLINLIKELLDVERLESGKMSMNPSRTTALWIVDRSIESVKVPADEKEIEITSTVADTELNVDADRLVQVMINLLSNAVKFSEPASKISISSIDHGDEFEFRVEDHGRGIPSSHVDKVFEKFQQVTADDSRKHGGTGLGLAICKAIVQQHGGEIGVNSIEGKGSTFWFRLPKQRVKK